MPDIAIDNRSGSDLPLARVEELALFVLGRELGREDLPASVELSISFVDIDEMTQLNATYRKKPEPTDVLSFEMDDPWTGTPERDGGHTMLGDIVIQPDIARLRADGEELSFEEELWVLVIHGILHLLGYDHIAAPDAEKMEAREDEHFSQWRLKLDAH
jgi:probable rRNA maturation factor